jgi:hypothetical protein
VVVQDIKLLPILCIAVLPAWLLTIGRPELLIPSGHDG